MSNSAQPIPTLAATVEAAILAQGGRQRGSEIYFPCPIHADTKPSARWNPANGTWYCDPCKKGGGTLDLAKRLGIQIGSNKPAKRIVATYDYQDETGAMVFQTVRMVPKDFKQRRPDGKGGWTWNLKNTRRLPYRLPELLAADPSEWVFVVEGEKDADGLRLLGLTATCNPMGAGKWHDEYAAFLTGRRVCVLPDNDQAGKEHGRDVVKSVKPLVAELKSVELPELPSKGDVSDWIAAGHTADELIVLADAAPPLAEGQLVIEPCALADVIETFRKWLFMPDPGPLELAIATVAANMASGDPVWLLLVGPPGSGKTEVLNAFSMLPSTHHLGTFTEASLLSGVSKKDVVDGARGGLLNEIGEFGILVLKDFGSVLSMHTETRAAALAALREVYDGAWTRRVGADGGKELSWRGKLGLVGGCTPIIDQHSAVMGALGERFALYRMPEGEDEERAEMALDHADSGEAMRRALAASVMGLFTSLGEISSLPVLTSAEKKRLIALASFATRCRSAIERDSRSRDIELIPGAESPTRLVVMLSLLLRSMKLIGVEDQESWRLIVKLAMDSMHQIRRKALEVLIESDISMSTTQVAEALGYPTQTTRRSLEDLSCYSVLNRVSQGKGQADLWSVTDWMRNTYQRATTSHMYTFPEKPGDGVTPILSCKEKDGFSGKVNGCRVDNADIRVPTAQKTVDRSKMQEALDAGQTRGQAVDAATIYPTTDPFLAAMAVGPDGCYYPDYEDVG